MTAKKSIRDLFVVMVIFAWFLGFAIPVKAETQTLKYKVYTYVIRSENIPVEDVEGHTVGLHVRGAFLVFENGEIGTINHVSTTDLVKGSGSVMQYVTIKFEDASTITFKSQGTLGGTPTGSLAAGGWTSEIIKGTGQFAGIKGTQAGKVKYLPVEKGESAPKGYGEGSLTFTLPPK
ncbi:MAG: hypothetical protein HXY45_15565 [Syntrophaceae bacterium]|nr:hypothetical protein [Syntrophaceae bacterium]